MSVWNEDLCRRVVDAAIGDSVPYHILSYRPWVLSRQVARKYRSGNIFLYVNKNYSLMLCQTADFAAVLVTLLILSLQQVDLD